MDAIPKFDHQGQRITTVRHWKSFPTFPNRTNFLEVIVLITSLAIYRVSQKKRSLRISKPLGPTDASGDNSVGKGCWRDVG